MFLVKFLSILGFCGIVVSAGQSNLTYKLDSNTVAYWKFDTSRAAVVDLSNNNLNGTLYNTIRVDSSASFSLSASSRAEFPSIDPYLTNNAFTIQAKVKVNKNPYYYTSPFVAATILGNINWNTTELFGLELRVQTIGNQCYLAAAIGQNPKPITDLISNTPIDTNVWYDVAVQYDKSFFTIFLNNQVHAQVAHTQDLNLINDKFFVGKRAPGTPAFHFDGQIKEIAVSNIPRLKYTSNLDPVFMSSPDTVALENHLYAYPIIVTDPDGDSVSLSLINYPDGMLLRNDTILFIPTINQVGIQYVSIKAEDSNGGKVFQNYAIRILPRSGQISLSSITPINDSVTINESDTVLFSLSAKSRNESAIITYQWYINTEMVSSDSFYVLRTDYSSAGVCSVKVVAYDGVEFIEHKWIVIVKNTPIKPVVISPREGNPANGDSLFKWSCSDPDLDSVTVRYEVHFMLFSQQEVSIKVLYALRDTEFVFRSFIERGELQEGLTYCWKVLAYDARGDSVPFSNNGVFFFTSYGTSIESNLTESPFLISAMPNPFNPTTDVVLLGDALFVNGRVNIVDVSGRIVRSFDLSKINNRISFSWDGRDNSGRHLPAGTYLLSVTAPNANYKAKLIMSK